MADDNSNVFNCCRVGGGIIVVAVAVVAVALVALVALAVEAEVLVLVAVAVTDDALDRDVTGALTRLIEEEALVFVVAALEAFVTLELV